MKLQLGSISIIDGKVFKDNVELTDRSMAGEVLLETLIQWDFKEKTKLYNELKAKIETLQRWDRFEDRMDGDKDGDFLLREDVLDLLQNGEFKCIEISN